jgi:lipopolysaccharide/colanic/teichoic acid biosynthesis glycosyltransferase
LSTEPLGHRIAESADLSSFLNNEVYKEADRLEGRVRPVVSKRHFARAEETEAQFWLSQEQAGSSRLRRQLAWQGLSPWSRSRAKRVFDCSCVILSLPILVPLMLLIGAAVRFTSRGPVLFLQERVGRHGRKFTILKFRTMVHVGDAAHRAITTSDSECFTPVGPFLRRWKLDELPQLLNVLAGHMSLVGPRPKMPEHALSNPPCRPGITGMATTVFACEEKILDCVAKDKLDEYFLSIVLPAKRRLDAEYMARASFFSDLRILVDSVLRRWDTEALDKIIAMAASEMREGMDRSKFAGQPHGIVQIPKRPVVNPKLNAEEISVV